MKIRPRVLPAGWYPDEAPEVKRTIALYLRDIPKVPKLALAGVAPHAGWYFSGKIALEVILSLKDNPDTVVVVGGHLGEHDGVLAAREDGYETPLGTIPADQELLSAIGNEMDLGEDRYGDNTVEIQLPFLKHVFPDSRALALRAAPSGTAIELGKAIRKAAAGLKREVVVLGSTDLTHYGSNYGFSPAGRGEGALRWVKEVNDRGLIESILALDAGKALSHAQEKRSACSAGGAAAALTFARESGAKAATLLRYLTSYDIYPGESFVGYAGIIFT